LAPVRLIVRALQADASVRRADVLDGRVSYSEIFALANDRNVNRQALPSLQSVIMSLSEVRRGNIRPPASYERRFHLLQHMELFELAPGSVAFRRPVDSADEQDLRNTIKTIASQRSEFRGFDNAISGDDIAQVIATGAWGEYFDGLRTLPTSDTPTLDWDANPQRRGPVPDADVRVEPERYPLEARPQVPPPPSERTDRRTDLADPEVTQVKRQRRNLAHKQITDKMDQLLRDLGAEPRINPHIDLFAAIPNDGRYIFEVKSGGENYLDQIRKAVSQLYEYRFRYRPMVGNDVALCLVVPEPPSRAPWLIDYLCQDREIALCWFTEDGRLSCPDQCRETLAPLFAMQEQ
jgi:hypothetical protein